MRRAQREDRTTGHIVKLSTFSATKILHVTDVCHLSPGFRQVLQRAAFQQETLLKG